MITSMFIITCVSASVMKEPIKNMSVKGKLTIVFGLNDFFNRGSKLNGCQYHTERA